MSVGRRPDTDALIKPVELVRAATVARRFFIEGRSKSQIAEELGLSRFKVARILDQARQSGLVRIEIGLPAELDADLSERLRVAFGLRHALVISTPDDQESELRAHLGEVAAGLLSEIVVEGDVLGIGWGRTLTAMTSALTTLARCTVVQLTGAVGVVGVREDSVETVRAVADVCGGPAFPIYAPFVLDDLEAAAAIRRQPHVAEALRRFDILTKAVVAVGSWDPPNSQLRELLSPEDRRGPPLPARTGGAVRGARGRRGRGRGARVRRAHDRDHGGAAAAGP